MLHVYGWRRDGGPYFLDNPRTLEDGIAFTETVLKDCRRGFVRAAVKNIRTLEVLSGSPHLSCGRPASGEPSRCAGRRSVHIMARLSKKLSPAGIDF